MWENFTWSYVQAEFYEILDWAKGGDSLLSIVPTLLWAVGTAALAHRLLTTLFRRFLFRRVPLWEVILQHLLFLWIIIYSLHFWVLLIRIIKLIINYYYDDVTIIYSSQNEAEPYIPRTYGSQKMIQQWAIWVCGVAPLAFFIHTRPIPEHPPLMIWITTSPWQRREMGPYGYYLNRPLSSLHSTTNLSHRHQALTCRRAFSDSKIILKEPAKKKKSTKSV